jgi:hypothetical protein
MENGTFSKVLVVRMTLQAVSWSAAWDEHSGEAANLQSSTDASDQFGGWLKVDETMCREVLLPQIHPLYGREYSSRTLMSVCGD